uniref:Uncharacterized protein n=2 Tax=Brassica oleracea TaxID=3712 RepID=A0A0D3DML7_BRAOL|nr:unnamed protein product [Brassica oleracea]
MTPDHVKTTCKGDRSLRIFKWVKREFVEKAKTRLCNTVSDWKDKLEFYVMRESPLRSQRTHVMASSPFGSYRPRSGRPTLAPLPEERRIEMLEKTGVLPSLSDLFKMTHATSDETFVDPASEKLFNDVAARVDPRKKGWTVGICSVNEVARATSSYSSRRDQENARMQARMDSQLDRLDSLEDLLDVMAVGNPSCREHWMKDGRRFDKGILNLPVKTLMIRALLRHTSTM